MSAREVGGKAKASSPLANAAKNAKTTTMEVDGAVRGATAATANPEPTEKPPVDGGTTIADERKPNPQKGEKAKEAKGRPSGQPNSQHAAKGGGGDHRQRKPKSKPKPGDPGWEAFRQKRNKRRAEAIRLKKKNGRRCPYALYIDASGVSTEVAKRIPLALSEWKLLLQQAIVQMAEDMLDMEKLGVESPGDKLYMAHQCFVEHVPKDTPKGEPRSIKPDNERFGHGAMFFDTEEAEGFAARAFRGTSVVREGRRFDIALSEKEVDRRATYSMVAQKVIWKAVSPYFWRCAKYAYRGLPDGEPEIVKEKATDRSEQLVVLVIKADKIWERCLDAMNERLFKLPFGRFVLRKKSEGIYPKPQNLLNADQAEAEAEEEEGGEPEKEDENVQ